MTDRAFAENRDVGRAAADIDQHHAEFLFVFRQHRERRRQRLQDQIVHFEPAAAHALDDVLRRAHRAGDDMHLHFEADAAHADRLAHIFLAVDDEFLREDMQHLLVGRNVDRLRRFDHARHVGLRDFLLLDRHHAARIEAADMAAGDPGEHVRDLAVGHQLGFFERALNGLHGGFDIHHHAFLEPLRFALAEADHLVVTFALQLGDDGHDLRRPNVEGDQQIFIVFTHSVLIACDVRLLLALVGFADKAHASGTNRETVRIAQVRILDILSPTLRHRAPRRRQALAAIEQRVLIAFAAQVPPACRSTASPSTRNAATASLLRASRPSGANHFWKS